MRWLADSTGACACARSVLLIVLHTARRGAGHRRGAIDCSLVCLCHSLLTAMVPVHVPAACSSSFYALHAAAQDILRRGRQRLRACRGHRLRGHQAPDGGCARRNAQVSCTSLEAEIWVVIEERRFSREPRTAVELALAFGVTLCDRQGVLLYAKDKEQRK